MTEKLDAHKVVDNVVTALNSDDDAASNVMLQEVNADLRKLSEPERNLVANELSLKGLLPDLAIETGLVGQETFITKDELSRTATLEGSTSLMGMSAKFLTENFSAVGGHVRQDVNSDYVQGFDQRYDLALETAQAKREYGGLLDLLKKQNPDNADIQSRDGLQAGDINALLSMPEQLTAEQTSALKTMQEHFEYMKTPRGIWTATDWTTPRITESSLDEFVDTGVPLGMREQLQIAEREKSRQLGLAEAAKQGQDERLKPPAVPADASTTQPETPPEQPEIPPAQPETPPTQPETPPAQPETPPTQPETPPAQPETPPTPPETPPAPPETPPAPPETPPAPPETTGDQPTPPDSLERDTVTDKEIEVVKGDNLWKIARAHLTEKDGKRPSNAEVLKLVNQIVERNNIQNPDLIYPGQKFIIPGDEVSQTAQPVPPPQEVPPPPPETPPSIPIES